MQKIKVLLAAVASICAGAADAQQAASADFAPAPKTAAADFAKTAVPSAGAAAASAAIPQCAPAPAPASNCDRKPKAKPKSHAAVTVKAVDAQPKQATPALVNLREVHPDVAVKDTPAPEIILPGVMKIAGVDANAVDFSRTRVIDATNDKTVTVYVSDTFPNRFQLPWSGPKLVGADALVVDETDASNNVYLQFKPGLVQQLTIWFDHVDGQGPVFGVELVPKQIPAQTIVLRDATKVDGNNLKVERASGYEAVAQALMESAALGRMPSGFSEVELHLPHIALGGLVVDPSRQYSSTDKQIYVYRVTNPGTAAYTVNERDFDGDSVLAVSVFPSPLLAPGAQANVIVLARKPKE